MVARGKRERSAFLDMILKIHDYYGAFEPIFDHGG
jgi:hypothetical protein